VTESILGPAWWREETESLPIDLREDPYVVEILALLESEPLLSPRERAVLLATAQGKTSLEIADELGLTAGNVRQILLRARRKILTAM
jgi:DNA-binding NarL/FixJ family response regulator